MRSLLFILLVLVVGCSGEVQELPEPPQAVELSPPVLIIDENFSAEQTEAILKCISEWFAAVPELARPVVIGDDPNIINGWPKDSPTEVPSSVGVRSLLGIANHYEKLWLSPERIELKEVPFERIALHELGHLFGIHGHIEAGNVMAKDADIAGDGITDEDVKELCEQWGHCSDDNVRAVELEND